MPGGLLLEARGSPMSPGRAGHVSALGPPEPAVGARACARGPVSAGVEPGKSGQRTASGRASPGRVSFQAVQPAVAASAEPVRHRSVERRPCDTSCAMDRAGLRDDRTAASRVVGSGKQGEAAGSPAIAARPPGEVSKRERQWTPAVITPPVRTALSITCGRRHEGHRAMASSTRM